MAWQYAVGAYAAYKVGKGVYQWWTTPEHNRLLGRTYDRIDEVASGKHKLFVDHITRSSAEGQPPVIGGHIPDILLKDFTSSNLIIEVETADSLEKHAQNQLRAFKKPGYKRVLVVPEVAVNDARVLAENVRGTVYVRTPETVEDLV